MHYLQLAGSFFQLPFRQKQAQLLQSFKSSDFLNSSHRDITTA